MAVGTRSDPLAPAAWWQEWMRRHPIGGPIVVGIVATQLATMIGYYMVGVGLPELRWADFNGFFLSVFKEQIGSSGSFFAGHLLHMTDGVIFTLLFAALLYDHFPFGSSTTWRHREGRPLRHHSRADLDRVPDPLRLPTSRQPHHLRRRARRVQLRRPRRLEAAVCRHVVALDLGLLRRLALRPASVDQPERRQGDRDLERLLPPGRGPAAPQAGPRGAPPGWQCTPGAVVAAMAKLGCHALGPPKPPDGPSQEFGAEA